MARKMYFTNLGTHMRKTGLELCRHTDANILCVAFLFNRRTIVSIAKIPIPIENIPENIPQNIPVT
jgi:hypothetical protein